MHRVLLAGMSGLALLGTFGLGGCAASPAVAEATQSQTLDLGAHAMRVPEHTLAAPAHPANDPQVAAPKAQTPTTPQRIKVLGQDVGATSDGLQNVAWSTYSATYHGQTYEFEYPKGWKAMRMPNGLAVVNPQKPQEYVAFQWRQDAGYMTAGNLIQTVLHEGGIDNTHVNTQQHQTRQTANGQMDTLSADLSYTVDGVAVRGQFLSGVTNMQGAVSIWSGFLTATQTPERDFAKDQPILLHVGNSLTIK